MTARYQLALVGLLALALGTGVTWFLMGDDTATPHDVGSGPASRSPGDTGAAGLLRGTAAPTGTDDGTSVPGGTNAMELVGAREPHGPDYRDPAFRAKKLAELLDAPAIQWREVQRLLAIMDEPLSEEAKRILVESLRTGPRGLVVEALAAVNDPTLAEGLFEVVDDAGGSAAMRQAALLALARMRGADADEVAKQLESRLSGAFRQDVHVLTAISVRGGGEAARAIIQYLTAQSDASMSAHAFNRFDLGQDGAAAKIFNEALLKPQSPVVMKQLLELVGKPGSAALVPALVKLEAGKASPEVRKAALRTLGRIGTSGAVEHLLVRARESGDMGEAALRSLDSLRSADLGAREALRKELDRANLAARPVETRTRVLRALGRLKDKDSLPIMLEALDDSDQKVERAAIIAIGGLGEHAQPAFARLVKTYKGANTGTRNAVVHAMGSLGGQEALKTLQEWSKEENLDATLTRMLRQAVLSVRHRLDAKQ